MKKKILIILLLTSLFTITGCDKEKNNTNTETSQEEMTEEEKIEDYKNNPEKYFSIEDAEDALLSYFNNEEGINFNYLDTVIVEDGENKDHYYKFDVRKHNEGGANSRLDIYYIRVDKQGGGIYDIASFKEKFGKE